MRPSARVSNAQPHPVLHRFDLTHVGPCVFFVPVSYGKSRTVFPFLYIYLGEINTLFFLLKLLSVLCLLVFVSSRLSVCLSLKVSGIDATRVSKPYLHVILRF